MMILHQLSTSDMLIALHRNVVSKYTQSSAKLTYIYGSENIETNGKSRISQNITGHCAWAVCF